MLPHLTNKQRTNRVMFTLSQLHLTSNLTDISKSSLIQSTLMRNLSILLMSLKLTTNILWKSKRLIIKCMFLAATDRPRYNHCTTKTWWDGKTGMYPVVELVPAKRNSKNRKAGNLEAKCVNLNRGKSISIENRGEIGTRYYSAA